MCAAFSTRSGQRRPVAKRSTGRGQGKGCRGRRRRGRTTPHIRHRSLAPRKHPFPHICPTHRIAHPPPLIAAVFHAQCGSTPFTWPLCAAHRWRWCRRSSRRTRRPPWRRTRYAAPLPLPRGSEALGGHQRSSYVIKGNQGSSFAIRGQSAALRATRWPLGGALRGHQRYSVAHQR